MDIEHSHEKTYYDSRTRDPTFREIEELSVLFPTFKKVEAKKSLLFWGAPHKLKLSAI